MLASGVRRLREVKSEELMLVIGAGPVGLGVAKALGEADVAYRVVEATDQVGGNWAHGVYESAHIISSKRTTEYPDWPMPADYPDFPSAEQMRRYYNAFADAHGLREKIRFDASVASVTPLGDLWQVEFEDGRAEQYKGVLVCNGHHWAKQLPEWTEGFGGEVLHTKDYKRPEQLRGRRVLVLGGGNSGCDLASEAARVGASCEWSLRTGVWILPKTVFGIPAVELIHPLVPLFVQRAVLKVLLAVQVGSLARYGLPAPDHAVFERHPTVNDEVLRHLKHGRVRPRPGVATAEGKTVVFTDGSRCEYDLVVCATGYRVAFPFFPPDFVPFDAADSKCPALVASTFVPHHKHLYLVGAYQVRYGVGPLVRPLARQLARWVRLQDELERPLSEVLLKLGARPPTSHLVDPHRSLRRLRWARHLDPWVRWLERRMRG